MMFNKVRLCTWGGITPCTNAGWGLTCRDKRGLRGNLINAYKYLQEGCQEDAVKLFSVVPRDRTRGKEHKLKERKFHMNVRKYIFAVRVTEHWKRLLRDVGESLFLETFKTHLDVIMCSLLQVNLLQQQGWTRWFLEVPFNPRYSVILWYALVKNVGDHNYTFCLVR